MALALNEIAKQIVVIFKKDKSYFEQVEWTAFYNKYNEEKLCFKDGWNFTVSDLVSKDVTDNLAVNAEKLKPFYEWLGERIALCLNAQRGKTNEEIKLPSDLKAMCVSCTKENENCRLKVENEQLKEREAQQHANIMMNNLHYNKIDTENIKLKQAIYSLKPIIERLSTKDDYKSLTEVMEEFEEMKKIIEETENVD